MEHKYKSIMQNDPTRHVTTAIRESIDEQITGLRSLDITNFFILGTLQSIKEVLGKGSYFD